MAVQTKTPKRMKYSSGVSGGLSNPKIMFLPPNGILEKGILSTADSSGIQFVDSNFLAELQRRNPHAKSLLPLKLSVCPPSSEEAARKYNDEVSSEDCAEPFEEENSANEADGEIGETLGTGNIDIDEEHLLIDHIEDLEPEVPEHDPTRCCMDCRVNRERFENTMIRKMNEILELVRTNAAQGMQRRRPVTQFLQPMPFDTVAKLIKFDTDVEENEQMRKEFIQKMQDIGGKSVQKSVKYCMEQVMTDELAKQVVWVLGGENVPKLSKFKFPYLIIEIIRERFAGCTIKDVERKIADWLRRGGDRIKGATAMANKRQHPL